MYTSLPISSVVLNNELMKSKSAVQSSDCYNTIPPLGIAIYLGRLPVRQSMAIFAALGQVFLQAPTVFGSWLLFLAWRVANVLMAFPCVASQYFSSCVLFSCQLRSEKFKQPLCAAKSLKEKPQRKNHILSGTSIPNNDIPSRTTLATFCESTRRKSFRLSSASLRME